jgi:carboxyl-terminal processing protease
LNSKSKYAILLLSSVLVIYAIIGGMLGRVSAQGGSYQQLSVFMDVITKIQNDYVDEPSMKDAFDGAIRGLIESIDPQGGYLTPKEVAFYKDYNQQKTPGVGAIFSKRAGYPIIVSVIPGSPAAKAGLSTGDFIEAIDGVTTREMNLVQVHSLLASPAGKPVSLTVIRRRRAEPETISLNREPPQAPAVEASMLEGNVAYLKIPYLGSGKALEAKKQLDGLLKKGATGIVLDLRFVAGGDDREGIELANLFVETGTIATLQGQKFEKQTFPASPKELLTKAPLVVLINQGTAGAAELAAGAISDNSRGQLVGTRTFGIGSYQRLLQLPDGNALLISVAKYYTPTGKEIGDAGITPNVEIAQAGEEIIDPSSEDQLDVVPAPQTQPAAPEDRQLKKAIEVLKNPAAALKKAA